MSSTTSTTTSTSLAPLTPQQQQHIDLFTSQTGSALVALSPEMQLKILLKLETRAGRRLHHGLA